ncbi:MAG: metallophosphoesterase [Erysipelotrichaceae bacterium]|nr:metallophosphoesterase [Erysipelotrichaceae bacterium]
MNDNEAYSQYLYARKIAKKTVFHDRLNKKDPYLKVLDDIVDDKTCKPIRLGHIDAPAQLIVGTKTQGRSLSFSSDFMPLLGEKSEFAAKWINVCKYHLSDEGINELPTAYEYLGKFYIAEGNKRVSVLKSYGAPFIPLDVIRLLPPKSERPSILLYYDFLEFYEHSKLYLLQFTKPEYYERLLRCLNMEKDHEWTRSERITLVGFYGRLENELDKKGIHENHADCLAALLEMYTYDYLVEMSDRQLDKVISENKLRLSHGKGFYNITCIADEEDMILYSGSVKNVLKDTDFIVSAGDLKKEYLEYIVTLTNKPLFYIHGNHDEKLLEDPPEGCICIDDDLIVYEGIRILGLGGSFLYNGEGIQFTEVQMERRIAKLKLKILKAKGVDIVVTHAPIKGYGELEDYAHQGFECFEKLLEELKPRFWFYGHVHSNYGFNIKRIHTLNKTMIVNVSGRYLARY